MASSRIVHAAACATVAELKEAGLDGFSIDNCFRCGVEIGYHPDYSSPPRGCLDCAKASGDMIVITEEVMKKGIELADESGKKLS